MSRLPLIQPETADSQAAELLAAVQKALGVTVTPYMTKAMANSPAVLKAYLEFSGALAGGVLPAAVRERIALLVAQQNACDYCLSAHTYIGTKLAGLNQEEAEAARGGRAGEPRAEAVLAFAATVLRTRGDIEDTDVKEARQAGLSDEEIAEVVGHVALNVFTVVRRGSPSVHAREESPCARVRPGASGFLGQVFRFGPTATGGFVSVFDHEDGRAGEAAALAGTGAGTPGDP